MEFKSYKIKDIGDVVTGFTPSKKEKDLYGVTFPFVTPSDISDSKYVVTKRFLDKKAISKKEKKICPKNSVGISCIGSDLGKAFFILEESFTNQQINTVTNIKENFDSEYIYYKLKTLRDYFHRIADGSTMPIINKSKFENLSLEIPLLKNQKKISSILSLLDNKIENNNKIVSNLEELTQTLFKRWFVDFEFPDENGNPYKSSGGEMVDSELGKIPKLWTKSILGNYIDLDKGLSYKGKFLDKKNEIKESIPMLSLSNFKFFSGFKNEKTKYYFGDYKDKHKVKAGDIIIAATDLTQDRKMLGAPALVPNLNKNMIYSLDVFKVKETTIPKFVLYFLMQTKKYREFVEGSATGTTVIRISKSIILKVPIVIDLNIAYKFDEKIKRYMDKIEKLNKENEILVELRDTLLPKLMSGELEVPDDIEVNVDELSV
ncbi:MULTISPECIES: restriction endonuclease subunit S [Staphylococcus]|uniref:restriction endonuclease subunit S n=1 Tax=Staphylococcus TaxID=1279 RepID=UPI00076B361A|nr:MULTISPECIES: restriction endonuclease subunit S [Staphylococcus]AMG64389.1 restriction endonuclease subunit S [Staphylococcus lugdunensis]MCI2814575.1 restriction endonuclease subunit S [Staphylococcus lugdunensis]MDU0967079.1 restriction endonuclease subunit S [Staphylococcus lugdunensis]MDU1965489.1 restriction endonuclease subunit S [Staphylococcus lugdunensis]MDU2322695.1 restriction endonuclease subunit S [Staphylococcus lugdunensis]